MACDDEVNFTGMELALMFGPKPTQKDRPSLCSSVHIVGEPPVERVRRVGRTITDQQKRRPFATFRQVSHGAVAAPAALGRLGARKKASYDVPF